jgi:hypothetical protein
VKLGTLIAALLLLSAAAGCGGGAPSPSAELSSFVVKYVDENQHNCCELGMHATVSHITFARSDPRWAVVRIAVTDAAGKPDGVDFFVVRKNGSSWDVIGYGHGALGCSVPVRIRAELSVGVPDDILSCPDSG